MVAVQIQMVSACRNIIMHFKLSNHFGSHLKKCPAPVIFLRVLRSFMKRIIALGELSTCSGS
eukprot:c42048_g1_i1 orf=19-204(+)